MENEVTEETEVAPAVPPEKLVKVYLKMKAKHDEMRIAYETEEKKLAAQMVKVKSALLSHCKQHNVESVRTSEGLFYRTTKMDYWTNDWESMYKFLVEHNALHLLHQRIHQTNLKEFLEAHPDLLPPGLNVDSEYNITVRRK
jgi:phage pi2 protein 07